MDSYMTSNVSCFTVTWNMFKNNFLKVGLTQKPRDHGTVNVHNHWFILFYHAWEPSWMHIHWNSIWLRAPSYMASHYTWGSVTTLHALGGALGRPLDTFVWAPRKYGHGSWPVCEMGLSSSKAWPENFQSIFETVTIVTYQITIVALTKARVYRSTIPVPYTRPHKCQDGRASFEAG